MAEVQDLKDVLVELLKDTYDAELQLVDALPKIIEAANDDTLKEAIQSHLAETEEHVARLEQAFELLELKPKRKKCKAMAGLLKEGDEAGETEGPDALVDATIIAAAQKVEHYEISAYGTLRTYAETLGLSELVELFEETLGEEKAADEKLTEVSQGELLSDFAGNG